MMNSNQTPPDAPELLQTETAPALRFLLALHMLINSARMHQDNNRVLITAVEQFVALLNHFFEEEDEVTLLTSAGRFYLHQERVVYRANIAGIVSTVLTFFEQRQLNGLRFLPASVEAPMTDI